jgi:hypothetical protein
MPVAAEAVVAAEEEGAVAAADVVAAVAVAVGVAAEACRVHRAVAVAAAVIRDPQEAVAAAVIRDPQEVVVAAVVIRGPREAVVAVAVIQGRRAAAAALALPAHRAVAERRVRPKSRRAALAAVSLPHLRNVQAVVPGVRRHWAEALPHNSRRAIGQARETAHHNNREEDRAQPIDRERATRAGRRSFQETRGLDPGLRIAPGASPHSDPAAATSEISSA